MAEAFGGIGLGSIASAFASGAGELAKEAALGSGATVSRAVEQSPDTVVPIMEGAGSVYDEIKRLTYNINPLESARALGKALVEDIDRSDPWTYLNFSPLDAVYDAATMLYNPHQTIEEYQASQKEKGALHQREVESRRAEMESLKHMSNVERQRLEQEKLLTKFGEYAVGNPRLYGEYFVGKGNIAPGTRHAAREQAGIPKDEGFTYFGDYVHQPLYGGIGTMLQQAPVKRRKPKDSDDDNDKPKGKYKSKRSLDIEGKMLKRELDEGRLSIAEFNKKMKDLKLKSKTRKDEKEAKRRAAEDEKERKTKMISDYKRSELLALGKGDTSVLKEQTVKKLERVKAVMIEEMASHPSDQLRSDLSIVRRVLKDKKGKEKK